MNSFARKKGCQRATDFIIIDGDEMTMEESKSAGYVKNSTGEYVSKAYYNKAWRNCHYAAAIFVVGVPKKLIIQKTFEDDSIDVRSILKKVK